MEINKTIERITPEGDSLGIVLSIQMSDGSVMSIPMEQAVVEQTVQELTAFLAALPKR